jgi:3-oxoacyl-[acyl-carrier protein] reductase
MEGVHVTLVARSPEPLAAAAAALRVAAPGVEVKTLSADVTSESGRAAALEVCPEPDILINNAGGPPPGDFRDWGREAWVKALDANMLAPIAFIRATLDGMVERGFGRIVNITSSAVKAPIASLGLSNGARAGLTGFVAGLSRQIAGKGVTINNLLPGAFDTDRLRLNIESAARRSGRPEAELRVQRIAAIPAGRFGDPAEFGAACAYLCSAQASYITGQNFLIDGGAYPGTL